MNRNEKLHIAKIAYKEMKKIVDNLESYLDADLCCNWDGTITVDEVTFFPKELEERHKH